VVITHGNGPQVGLLALQSDAYDEVATYPLDVLVAESEGMIGYILETELDRVLDVPILTVLSRTVVRADDPAFEEPTKPIGPIYETTGTLRRLAERGWQLRAEGTAFRRVVPSPEPVRIVQIELIRMLVDHGVLVVCAGGGGIPVVERDGETEGVEAVVDKDYASSLLAIELGADLFVSLTDVDGVFEGWGTPDQLLIGAGTPGRLRSLSLPAGSMGPKVEAACRFTEATGNRSAIGRLDQADLVVAGLAGTQVVPD
jgi:carbamate kinase